MTRGTYTKWIIGAACLLLIVAAGCYWYYQHTTAQYKAEAEQTEKLLKQWEADKAKPPAETETTHTPAESTQNTAEKPTHKIGEGTTETNTDKPTDIPSIKTEGAYIKIEGAEEPKISPHGFGPYPRVPKDYFLTCGPTPWQMMDLYGLAPPSREIELIYRVMVKLWQEGDTQIQGGEFNPENGKVYVNYRDRVYIRYGTITNSDGTTSRYISGWSSHVDVPAPTQAEAFAGHIPEGLEVIDLDVEDPGIEPYSFLGLEK